MGWDVGMAHFVSRHQPEECARIIQSQLQSCAASSSLCDCTNSHIKLLSTFHTRAFSDAWGLCLSPEVQGS